MERQEFLHNGVCHLITEAVLPDLPKGRAGERIGAQIGGLLAHIEKCAEAALPRLAARYSENENPKKHLLHRPLLLSLSLSLAEDKGRYRLTAALSLSRSGRVLWETKQAARLDKQSGRFY